jgi:chromosome segregation protein
MLKALELLGFKSFADRTRFEFPPGITAVVGPNGSGKSNVVDAIKWVLGEQSVKSLRGREMADVIFNGSPSRRGTNSAEITITLDNSKRLLAVDAPEVHITRRVYRSGEGEYLLNRQPCRLRDIRDLLAGTGLGSHAYSVIEQGKVDVLLQASPQDRRMIFEEAAGIGRFKAKKIEALRRLERVEQNLLRLSDIVDEVDNRLRSVKTQAGKARRYKQYADRLQELRTQVGLVDWRRASQRLAEFEVELQSSTHQRDAAATEAEVLETQLLEADAEITRINDQLRQSEQRTAASRERIAACESTIEHQRAHHADLEQQVSRHRRQSMELTARAGDLAVQLHDTAEAVTAAEEHRRQIGRALAEEERGLTDLIHRLDQIRGEHQQRRTAYLEQARTVAALANRIVAFESQAAAIDAVRRKNRERATGLADQLQALAAELTELHQRRETLRRECDGRKERRDEAAARLADRSQEQSRRHQELQRLLQRRTAIAERIAVLQELEAQCEGLGPGVREVLARARDGSEGPLRAVHGLVADLFQVGIDAASLVDVALGEKAQLIVAQPTRELLAHLEQQSSRLSGRVGFLWLDAKPPRPACVELEGLPGVLGRADRFVQTEPAYRGLVEWLLDRTWMVENLSQALGLSAGPGAGLSFVTLAGELLAADGTLTVGPRLPALGLISRRSELRALRVQHGELEAQIQGMEQVLAGIQREIVDQQERVAALTEEHQTAISAEGQHAHKITAAEERRTQLDRQQIALETELRAAEEQYAEAAQQLAQTRAHHRAGETAQADLETRMAALAQQIDQLEADRAGLNRNTTETKVELAKSEERLRNLQSRRQQFEEGQQERQRAIADLQNRLAECQRAAAALQREILAAEAEVAELYLRKESNTTETAGRIGCRDQMECLRAEKNSQLQQVRGKMRKLEEKIHAQQLAANELLHERDGLAARLREDYGIELAELEHEPTAEEQRRREEVQEEIDQLRQKLSNLGNVNLEALEELEQLEARHANLSDQHRDLSGAKNSLVKIIETINTDSRRLFAETLQTVKGHFGQLFRDLFGGGRADIVLDEGVDILESGIEIVARPPGKEPRSISLLSGGEKTLTAAALLLAIFRSRPSSFCVLDEVDAALDEANIDRFIKVLQEFLTWTQFVLVTHSKKTMTCANTIYGVTMQESGVSKQVSVRFEDISDNGELRLPPENFVEQPASGTSDDETQAA